MAMVCICVCLSFSLCPAVCLPLQRVMASGFYILLRFFLRVDEVIVRMNDTRIYHQVCHTPH